MWKPDKQAREAERFVFCFCSQENMSINLLNTDNVPSLVPDPKTTTRAGVCRQGFVSRKLYICCSQSRVHPCV